MSEIKHFGYSLQQIELLRTHQEEKTLADVLDFIKHNFLKLNDDIDLIYILTQIHCKLLQEAKMETTACNINKFVKDLLQQYQHDDDDDDDDDDNDTAYELVLQMIYQILLTVNMIQQKEKECVNLNIEESIMILLIDNIFEQRKCQETYLAKVLACLHLYLTIGTSTNLMQHLWLKLNENWHINKNWQILVDLYDHLINDNVTILACKEYYAMLEDLLNADQRESRKAAYYLMKKLLINWQNTIFYKEHKINENHWSIYVTILENLEENQSHLIMPALSKLEVICGTSDESHLNRFWLKWLNLLYKKLLIHQNMLVKRWTIEFILKSTNWLKLHVELREHFLNSLNSTNLYNEESYFLPKEHYETFFNCAFKDDRYFTDFLTILVKINWKSVPLHFCLTQINRICQEIKIEYDLLLQVASCIRKLQNTNIREDCIRIFFWIFHVPNKEFIEYCKLIKTLHPATDSFIEDMCIAFNSLKESSDREGDANNSATSTPAIADQQINYYTKYFFDLINWGELDYDLKENLLIILNELPISKHGYMRFIVVSCLWDEEDDSSRSRSIAKVICESKYNLDISALKALNTLNAVQNVFQTNLNWNADENSYINNRANEFFIKQKVNKLTDLFKYDLKVDDFLDMINDKTMMQLLKIVKDCCIAFNSYTDEELLKKVIDRIQLNTRKQCKYLLGIMEEISGYISSNILEQLYIKIFKFLYGNCNGCYVYYKFPTVLLKDSTFLINYLMTIDINKLGDARIENNYISRFKNYHSKVFFNLQTLSADVLSSEDFIDKLLALNQELNLKNPRYFHNSPQHHMQLRIAYTLRSVIFRDKHIERLWKILLEQNNQLDVTLCYEMLIAKNAKKFDEIVDKLEKINDYTASQQVSILSIAYFYYMLNFEKLQTIKLYRRSNFIYKLLPLTMGSNFQIRLYAQLYIYKILDKRSYNEEKRVDLLQIMKAIVSAMDGKKLSELLRDIRVRMPYYGADVFNIICYITNAPIDEYGFPEIGIFQEFPDLDQTKELFKKKLMNVGKSLNDNRNGNENENGNIDTDIDTMTAALETTNMVHADNRIQRKIQPLNNLLPAHNFQSFPMNYNATNTKF